MRSLTQVFTLLVLGSAVVALQSCGADSTTGPIFTPPSQDASGGSAGNAAPDAHPDNLAEAADSQDPKPDVVDPEPEPEPQPEPQPEAGPQDTGPNPETGDPWPTCDTKPSATSDMTISAIWAADPASTTYVWVQGVFISAISKDGCVAGSTCQIYLQDAETYANWGASAHHGIKLLVSANTASYFTSLKVGDKVDVAAHAWRYNLSPPQDELLLQVNKGLPGCAKAIGKGVPAPVTGVQLTDLTVEGYEHSHGPILLQVSAVTGKPGPANQIFALWNTAGPYVDSGIENVPSISPYFLPNGSFSGLPTDGSTPVKFETITGVFGLFVPSTDAGTGPKYLVLYPRTMADIVKVTP